MIRVGLKQIFKKKVGVACFMILLIAAIVFLSLGIYLFAATSQNLKEIHQVFRTIGTLEQKPTGYIEVPSYDAISESYTYTTKMEYGAPVPLRVFDLEGVDYIYPPENRPYYQARSEEYAKGKGETIDSNVIAVIEFQVADIYPEIIPVRAVVTCVLSGAYQEGDEVWICQHHTDNPVPLEIGKTYVCGVGPDMMDVLYENYHGMDPYTALNPVSPFTRIYSSQIGPDGEMLDTKTFEEYAPYHIFEVTDGFYETDMGKRLRLYAQHMSSYIYSARITPTNSLELLLEFFQRDIYLQDGREITQEEFDEGTPVCMIDADHAQFNGLSPGDTVTFSFYAALYGDSPGETYAQYTGACATSTLLNANGELFDYFYEDTYEIVGIYERYKKTYYDLTDPYALGYGTVLIPAKSVKASDENNRNGNLILQPYNVSFELPNGTSGAFLQKIEEAGLSELVNVTIYDRGYENIKAGLENIQQMAVILMLAGSLTSLGVLIFFSYLFIGREKRRTGIERSLGVPKRQCAASLLTGLMILVILGSAAGTAAGFMGGDFVMKSVEEQSRENAVSTMFSNWVNEQNEMPEYTFEAENDAGYALPVIVFFSVLLVSGAVAGIFVHENLKKEPMMLLSGRE